MKWIKKGLIFKPSGNIEWMKTHASVPIADKIGDNIYRIYFSARNSKNVSSIGYIEIDITNPQKIIKQSKKPVLIAGKLGTFDDAGVMGVSLVNCKNRKYLYYVGWNQPKNIPFRWSIGLAVSVDNGKTFQKHSVGPIMDRNPVDPYFVSSPSVYYENGIWKMYYISGLGWKLVKNDMICPYNLRYAESIDGINWKRDGRTCIDFKNKKEKRIGRVSIFKENNKYRMLFSYASNRYKIGYAESHDGLFWKRNDELSGIDVSETGWDSKMIEYPHVFEHNGMKYLLYNGNNYGKSGFGYAILEHIS